MKQKLTNLTSPLPSYETCDKTCLYQFGLSVVSWTPSDAVAGGQTKWWLEQLEHWQYLRSGFVPALSSEYNNKQRNTMSFWLSTCFWEDCPSCKQFILNECTRLFWDVCNYTHFNSDFKRCSVYIYILFNLWGVELLMWSYRHALHHLYCILVNLTSDH